MPTGLLCPGLARLLDVRRVVGLRNPAHSLVKLMNPCSHPALVVGSYTHPEYAESMAATLQLVQASALLLRGTEGEPVADPRRTPAMDAFANGQMQRVQVAQAGPLAPTAGPAGPRRGQHRALDRISAEWSSGRCREPIALQVSHLVRLARTPPSFKDAMSTSPTPPRPLGSLHTGGRRPGRPGIADTQGAQGDPSRHPAAGGRPGQRRHRGLCRPHRPCGVRGQARRLPVNTAGLH